MIHPNGATSIHWDDVIPVARAHWDDVIPVCTNFIPVIPVCTKGLSKNFARTSKMFAKLPKFLQAPVRCDSLLYVLEAVFAIMCCIHFGALEI